MVYMLLEAAGNNKTGRYEAHGLKAVLFHLNHRQSILPSSLSLQTTRNEHALLSLLTFKEGK